MNRYRIGILAFFGLAILLTVLLFTSGGSHKTPPKPVNLGSYADTNAIVRMVVDGPIVAPEKHNSADVTVSQYSAIYNLYLGYDGQVITSKIYNNTVNSYSNFLYALKYAGFMRGQNSTVYSSDIGLCPTGDRYDFYLINNGQTLEHYWVTSCSGVPTTYKGNFALTSALFEGQIPDINTLNSGANF